MPFPKDVRAYFQIDGAWVPATGAGGVYQRDSDGGVFVRRGYTNENGQLQPAVCNLTVKNHDLRYSQENPLSPLYGKFGQNTPCRVFDGAAAEIYGCWTNASAQGGCTTSDSVATSITGDVDLRAEVPLAMPPTSGLGYSCVGKPSSYFLYANATNLTMWWNNSVGTLFTKVSTATIPTGHTGFRATLDVDNGASGHTVTFYTAPTMAGPWVQLGAPVVTAGTTNIRDSAFGAFTGGTTGATGALCVAKAQILSGIGGTVVASPDYTIQAAGAGGFVDAQGNTWVVDSESFIGYGTYGCRFYGEISTITHRSDTSGNDRYVELEIRDIAQRVSQGTSEVETALESWVVGRTSSAFKAEGYWPLNEGQGAVAGRSRLGGADMVFTRPANPNGRFGNGDLRLPWFDNGVALYTGDRLQGVVNMSAGSATAWEFDFVYACQDGADVTVNLYTANKKVWRLYVKPSTGEIGFSAPDGGPVLASDLDIDLFDGVGKLVQFRVYPDAGVPSTANAYIVISTNYEGEGTFGTNDILDDGFSVGVPLTPVSRLEWFEFEHSGEVDKEFALSHVAAFSALGLTSIYTIEVPAAGNILEQASVRMARLCAEKSVPFTTAGAFTTAVMGAQKPTNFLDSVQECAAADMGLLFTPRDAPGFRYRQLAELNNNAAVLTLDYGMVSQPFLPVRDDQLIRNDVTAQRTDGGKARFEQTVGRYAVTDPASGGVGRYDEAVTVNVAREGQLLDTASWLAHRGTWDEARFPTVTVKLANQRFRAEGLEAAVLGVDIGDRIDIANAQASGSYDTIQLLVIGYSERFDKKSYVITFVCVPQRPYQVLTLNAANPLAKLDSLGTSAAGAVGSADTSILAALDRGEPYWTTDPAQMPIPVKLGGEKVNITASATGFTFVGVGTAAHAVNASVTPGFPAGTHKPGDLVTVLAAIRNSGAGTPVAPDSTWTTLAASGNVALFGKPYTVGMTAPTVTFTGGVANADTTAQMATFRGVLPVAYASASQLNSSAQDIAVPGVDLPSALFTGLVLYIGWKQDDWTSVDTLASSTEVGEPDTTTGDDQGLVWDYRVVPTEFASLGSRTFTVTGGASAISRGMVVCFENRVQEFTVTRAQNGVTKSHPAGTRIQLDRRATLAHARA